MRIGRVIAGMLLAMSVFVPTAKAQTVKHVDVTVAVDENAVLEVTEVWDVYVRADAEMRQIENPLLLPDTTLDDVDVLEIAIDGEPKGWTLTVNDGLFRLIIDKEMNGNLPAGNHQFVFRYRVSDLVIGAPHPAAMVWAFAGYVVGFEFTPKSSATITLVSPPGMFLNVAEAKFGGASGDPDTGQPLHAKITEVGQSQAAAFTIPDGLTGNNGFYFTTKFADGFVRKPTATANLYKSIFRIEGIWGPLPLAVTLCFFLVAIWLARHRQPRLTENLSGPLSPAVMRFLDRGAYDPAVLTAAFLNLVHRNRIQLRRLPDGAIEAVRGPDTSLPSIEFEEERHIVADLFPEGMTAVPISFTGENHFKTIHEHFRREIDRRLRGKRDTRIRNLLTVGFLVGSFAPLLLLLGSEGHDGVGFAVMAPMMFALFLSNFIVSITKLFRDGDAREARSQIWSVSIGLFLGVYFLWNYLKEGIEFAGYGLLINMGAMIAFGLIMECELNRRFVPPPDAARQIDAMRVRIAGMVQSRTDGSAGEPLPDELIPYAVALDRQGHWTWATADRIRKLLDPEPAPGRRAWYDNDNIGLVQFGTLAPSLRGA